jgi:uncharacterized protein
MSDGLSSSPVRYEQGGTIMARSAVRFLTGAVLMAGLATSGGSAVAQVLTCAKPTTPVDRTLCGSADLKVAVDDVAAALRDTLVNTPVNERDAVQRGQQSFLSERDKACADRANLDGCRRLYERRVTDLQAQNSAAQKRLAAIAAAIPKDPKAAAIALQRYDGPAAKAWLVYLHQSGQGPLPLDKDAKESAVRSLVSAIIDRDLPPDPELKEEMKALGDVAAAPLATTLLFLRHVLSTTEMDAPCFLFTKHGEAAFEAFGAFWGNSRDASPALCEAPTSVFDLPEWKKVEERMTPGGDLAQEDHPPIRQGVERQFDIDSLQASLMPATLLDPPQSDDAKRVADQRKATIAAFRAWRDFTVWSEADYKATIAALPAALTVTARVYREKFGLNPQVAEQAARAAADRFVAARMSALMPDE